MGAVVAAVVDVDDRGVPRPSEGARVGDEAGRGATPPVEHQAICMRTGMVGRQLPSGSPTAQPWSPRASSEEPTPTWFGGGGEGAGGGGAADGVEAAAVEVAGVVLRAVRRGGDAPDRRRVALEHRAGDPGSGAEAAAERDAVASAAAAGDRLVVGEGQEAGLVRDTEVSIEAAAEGAAADAARAGTADGTVAGEGDVGQRGLPVVEHQATAVGLSNGIAPALHQVVLEGDVGKQRGGPILRVHGSSRGIARGLHVIAHEAGAGECQATGGVQRASRGLSTAVDSCIALEDEAADQGSALIMLILTAPPSDSKLAAFA